MGEGNPKTTHLEWGGVGGAIQMILTVTLIPLYFVLACQGDGWFTAWRSLPSLTLADVSSIFTLQAFLVVTVWWLWLAVLYYAIPTTWVEGTVLRDGRKLRYPMNGWRSFVVTVVALWALHTYRPYGISLTWVADNFPQVAAAAITFSWCMSIYLYVSSFGEGKLLALGGNSGNIFYDFWVGRELNPRLFNDTFDLKFFNELRPGLIGWAVINASFALKQLEETGSVSTGMILVNVFELYYVLDALWFESCILSTIDITTDGFGLMLAFGDLAWVPITYSLQAQYLATHTVPLSNLAVAAIILTKLIGLWIFRSSNLQKDRFRTQPDHPAVASLKYIPTERTTRLLNDGWWGMARHINYFGDWLMAWSWCLPTGFDTPFTYFYVIYFGFLLVMRERRDDHKCSGKYGAAWDKYVAAVPYRIIPYIY